MDWDLVVLFSVPIIFWIICRFLCGKVNSYLTSTKHCTKEKRIYKKDENNHKYLYSINRVPLKRKFLKMSKIRYFLISFLIKEEEVEVRVIVMTVLSFLYAMFMMALLLALCFTHYIFLGNLIKSSLIGGFIILVILERCANIDEFGWLSNKIKSWSRGSKK
jgi:hypothetical protein